MVFIGFRWKYERPENKKAKCILLTEEIGVILCLLILYLSTNVIAVTYIVTLFIYLWYLTLVVDLVDLYLIKNNMVMNHSWLPCLEEKKEKEEKASSSKD